MAPHAPDRPPEAEPVHAAESLSRAEREPSPRGAGTSSASAAPRPRWAGAAERGSLLALRTMIGIYRALGRRVCQWLLHPIALYFLLTATRARRASLAYLARVAEHPEGRRALGHEPGMRASLRHIHEFSTQILDRMCVWAGDLDRFEFIHRGAEHLEPMQGEAGERRGGVILGSHVGSFDMLRSYAGKYRVPINVVMYTANAPAINAFFRELDPEVDLNVISLEGGTLRSAFEIRARVDRGEIVAILADRVPPDPSAGSLRVPFLGGEARFPTGPFELALVLRCPVLVAVGMRVGDATYEVVSEAFCDGAPVPRRERAAKVRELVERFAATLETTVLRDPYQWFNFYDFWD